MTTQTKVFYGIFVDTFALGVAATSTEFSLQPILTINLILSRRQKGTLETKSPEFKAVKAIPVEVWDQIKGHIIIYSLKPAKQRFLKRIWGNCGVIQSKKRVKFPHLSGYEDCQYSIGGHDRCLCCYESVARYFNQELRNQRINLKNLYHATGIQIESEDILEVESFDASLRGLSGLTVKHKNLPATEPFTKSPRASGTIQNAYDKSPDEIVGITFPSTVEEELLLYKRFKLFVQTYQLQSLLHPACYTSPFLDRWRFEAGEENQIKEGDVPRWIEWRSESYGVRLSRLEIS